MIAGRACAAGILILCLAMIAEPAAHAQGITPLDRAMEEERLRRQQDTVRQKRLDDFHRAQRERAERATQERNRAVQQGAERATRQYYDAVRRDGEAQRQRYIQQPVRSQTYQALKLSPKLSPRLRATCRRWLRVCRAGNPKSCDYFAKNCSLSKPKAKSRRTN
ncbi:MAG TPA: hypothetical protein VMX97_12130 [Hyphomicrobiaceae bacterium]|nr:hypothetical protein [Hyphomicrobiaceae bacterium]